ncbi:MAG: hypothetical protein AB2L13_13980 [Spirochaetota bacterium]
MKARFSSRNVPAILAAVLLCLTACDDSSVPDVLFSYGEIMRKEYRGEIGRAIPVTIEQSVEMEGSFTPDGLFFFFTSDREKGNFDIYLRSLTDITTVRVTDHPSRDSSPVLSPDGKHLAFVSQREDPEGDIYLMRLDPAALIDEARSSTLRAVKPPGRAVNLTQYQDPSTGTVRIVKDATPCWSPDGRLIAFSSTRGGDENIWIMDRKGRNLRQLTREGGTQPRFSGDGKKIIFVSYRDADSGGDIHTIELASGVEKRLTAGPAIEMHPCFLRGIDEIAYTLIAGDTNGDGRVDLKDNSVIQYRNLATGREYPLTLLSRSSFSPRWSPVFDGVIVYSDQAGGNININIIPDYGIIPKRESARRQYELAEKYLQEFDDTERYLLALERVYHFFGAAGDAESVAFVARSVADAARANAGMGRAAEASRLQKRLVSISAEGNDYRTVLGRYIGERLSGRPGARIISEALSRIKAEPGRAAFVPYLKEDLADEHARSGNRADAADVYREILKSHGDYGRSVYIHYKLAVLESKKLSDEIHPSFIAVLDSSYIYLRNDAMIRLLELFEAETDAARRLAVARGMLVRYRDNKLLPGLLLYVAGKAHLDMGDTTAATSRLRESLKIVRKSDIVYYRSNVLLGDIAGRERNAVESESYYAAVANNYVLSWKQHDFPSVVVKLVEHYEEFGERAELAGDYAEAVALYQKYVRLLTSLHLKKRFEDIYNEYGARAHVLYIDAFDEWKGGGARALKDLEREYLKHLPIARMDFDKAHIYGLGYIHAKTGVALERQAGGVLSAVPGRGGSLGPLLESFRKCVDELDWALFIDDTFVDPYLLKGWVLQYVDLRRGDDRRESGGGNESLFARFFPRHLWEGNIRMYEKALEINDEALNPGKEGNLHLNMANSYFLLTNYPRALNHYELAARFKRGFNSRIEEALFYHHLGYCYWQAGRYGRAREELKKTLDIYRTMASGRNVRRYRYQIADLYRFFGLLSRMENDHAQAIAWFNRVLDFAAANRLRIDRARYLQEIAYCHRELGDTETALSYLDMAESALKRYDDAGVKYRLEMKLLGLGPIPVWNLGSDIAVIGENRIFTELDTMNKRLLNLSLQEETHYGMGDYRASIRFLERKLELLGGRSGRLDNETRIRTVNNIGYCRFLLHEYDAARAAFTRAWELAADPKVDDQEGAFVAIINLANLYAFMAENTIGLRDPVPEIGALIERITAFRNGYEKRRLASETTRLESEAGALRREPDAAEIRALGEKVAEETAGVHYDVDIALSALRYYRAELLAGRETGRSAERLESARRTFAKESEVYRLYSQAEAGFSAALERAGERASRRLSVRLLLNAARCRDRLGMIDQAYEALMDAESVARKFGYDDLLWMIDASVAGLLRRHGESLEGARAAGLAAERYRRAISAVEARPLDRSGAIGRIRRLYDEFAGTLAMGGDARGAISVLERRRATERILLVRAASPDFYRKEDSLTYRRALALSSTRAVLAGERSRLLEAGARSPGDLSAIDKSIADNELEFARLVDGLESQRPAIASFLRHRHKPLPEIKGGAAFEFLFVDGIVHGWRLKGKNIEYRVLGDAGKEGRERLRTGVKRFLSEAGEDAEPRFVLFDGHSAELFRMLGPSGFPPFMFSTSLDDAANRADRGGSSPTSLYTDDRKLREKLQGIPALVRLIMRDGTLPDRGLARFSVLVYPDGADGPLSNAALFGNRLDAEVLFLNMKTFDEERIALAAIAARYAGAHSVVVCHGLDSDGMAAFVGRALGAPRDRLNADIGGPSGIVFALGRAGSAAGIPDDGGRMRDALYAGFIEELRSGDAVHARVLLDRWNDSVRGDANAPVLHALHSAELALLTDDHGTAVEMMDRALAARASAADGLFEKALALKAYLLLYDGASGEAVGIIDGRMKGSGAESADYRALALVADIARGGAPTYDTLRAVLAGSGSLVPADRLRLLIAEYLYLNGREPDARRVVSGISSGTAFSPREVCKIALLGGEARMAGALPRRTAGIIELFAEKDGDRVRMKAAPLLEEGGRFDALSVFPVAVAVDRYSKSGSFSGIHALAGTIDLDRMAVGSFWLDSMPLFMRLYELAAAERRRGDALAILGAVSESMKGRNVPAFEAVYRYALGMELLGAGRYHDSYESAKLGRALLEPAHPLLTPLELLLLENEISLGRFDEASARAASLGRSSAGYRYVLELLGARQELARILKKKDASEEEWRQVETRVIGGLRALDASTDVLSAFNRIDLVEQNLDFMISYRMSRRDYLSALFYAETKKQLQLRSRFPGLASGLPGEARREFEGIRDRIAGRNRFIRLLNEYPALQAGAVAGVVPIESFQRRIPDTAVVIYLVKNGKDILGWTISRQFIEPFRIKDGYDRALLLAERYREAVGTFGSVASVSRDLATLFKPFENYYRGKESVVFIVDNDLEQVPFEIAGEKRMLDETHRVAYCSSIISALRDYEPVRPRVSMIGGPGGPLYQDIERVAMRQSGIAWAAEPVLRTGSGHFMPVLAYNPMAGTLSLGGRAYTDIVKGGSLIYLPAGDAFGVMGQSEFALFASMRGARALVINDAAVHDVNNAVFVDVFYRELAAGTEIGAAFERAKQGVRSRRQFSHPAFWAGIRLYLNALDDGGTGP